MTYIFILYLFGVININIFIYKFGQTLNTINQRMHLELYSFVDIGSTIWTIHSQKKNLGDMWIYLQWIHKSWNEIYLELLFKSSTFWRMCSLLLAL
jgi:hypothetical protein